MNLGFLGNAFNKLWSGAKGFLGKWGGYEPVGQAAQQNATKFTGSGMLGGMNQLFGGGQGLAGLGMMGLGAMIPSARPPAMPSEFTNYMNQLQGGGTPGMQAANQYYQSVLSGQNQGAYDAVTSSIEDSLEQERRNLISTYKSLRPGTDITTDATFKRDSADLEDRYAKQLALARAGVQSGAASSLAGIGGQLSQMIGSGAQNYLDLANAQWANKQNKRNLMSSSLMGLGSNMWSLPYQYNLMNALFK